MKYEDLSFNMINEEGIEVICDITAVVPNNNNAAEPFVVFTDYTLDDNNEFIKKYGKLKSQNDEYQLEVITNPNVIHYINRMLKDEVVSYVNEQIQENMQA